MLKRAWVIIGLILMYGGCAALFLSFLFQWGRVAIIVSIGVILLSMLLSYWKLRCPHCKKLTIPTKGMLLGLKIGTCVCANCGEEVEIK